MTDVLDVRALNRATLARQLLLDRGDMTVHDAVAHLCGLQAQEPQEPFVAGSGRDCARSIRRRCRTCWCSGAWCACT